MIEQIIEAPGHSKLPLADLKLVSGCPKTSLSSAAGFVLNSSVTCSGTT